VVEINTISGNKITYNSSGNLGLGVTPSAWSTSFSQKALQFGPVGSLMSLQASSSNNQTYLSSNAVQLSGGWTYMNSDYATWYRQYAGTHAWFNSGFGTAGNLISETQAMTLDASSNLLVGTTTARNRLTVVSGAGSNPPALGSNGGVTYVGGDNALYGLLTGVSTSGYSWMQAQRVDGTATAYDIVMQSAGGNLLVGTMSVANSSKQTIGFTGSTTNGLSINDTQGTNASVGYANFSRSGTSVGSVTYASGTGLTSYNSTSDYRAKDIISSVTNSGEVIDSVPVYIAKMKGATQERPMFIAHEVPAYAHTGVKDAVDADGKPVYQQMDASALIPVMWAEIQSLRQRLSAANL
jgi:hypothetical protein